MGSSEVCSARTKLMCAVRGLQAIIVHNFKDSFTKTGLWPTQFKFANRFRTTSDLHKKHVVAFKETKYQTVVLLRTLQRRNDESTARGIGDVVKKNIGPSRKLQAVQIILKRSQTINYALMGLEKGQGSRRSSVGSVEAQGRMKRRRDGDDSGGENISSSDKRNGVSRAATPVLYLTYAQKLADREKRSRKHKISEMRNKGLHGKGK